MQYSDCSVCLDSSAVFGFKTNKTQKHIIFSHKFLFVCAMQIENLQYRKNSTNTAVARALLFLYLLSRRGGRTIHRIVCLSARSIPYVCFINQKKHTSRYVLFVWYPHRESLRLTNTKLHAHHRRTSLLFAVQLLTGLRYPAGAGAQFTGLCAYPPVRFP